MNRSLFFFLFLIFSSNIEAQEVLLSTKYFLNNSIELLVPVDFLPMEEYERKRRFHGKDAPVIVYSSFNNKSFIAVTDTISNANPDSLRYYLDKMTKGLESFSRKEQVEVNSKIETINGCEVAYLESIYQKDNYQIYDLKFFTKFSNSLILFNLHFEDEKIDVWKMAATRIVYSFKSKESSK